MRTFQRAILARQTLAACVLTAGLLLGKPIPAYPASRSTPSVKQDPSPADNLPSQTQVALHSFAELQTMLDEGDQVTALHALQIALSQIGDGATFAWKKNNKDLKGVIKPTAVFRNSDGQICRHVIYALALGPYRKQIEFIACREAGGRWRL